MLNDSHPTKRPSRPPYAERKEDAVSLFGPFRRQVKRAAVRALERRWLGFAPLRAHVVICGFPRSGTTLLQLMVQTAVPNALCFGRERSGLRVAQNHWPRRHPFLVTKRPDDIYWVDEIREHYAGRGAGSVARFVVCVRDPRAILTSQHSNGREYYVSVERWRTIYEHFRYVTAFPDVCIVDFRDLVSNPMAVQQKLTGLVGWTPSSNFDEFYKKVPQEFDTRALNGVRRLDPSVLEKWTRDEHRDRIRNLIHDMPELPMRLLEMGYESDTEWTTRYGLITNAQG